MKYFVYCKVSSIFTEYGDKVYISLVLKFGQRRSAIIAGPKFKL